ncbi:MAG: GNAT family N-acetyltransferase [Acidobacteria bacterium]|nr:GNAT family N-acetyltransferase [Acidobacteriota bacterium]MBI3422783.1 GNAT family N-acetyltransferase [Acidobacteriota bacterium]
MYASSIQLITEPRPGPAPKLQAVAPAAHPATRPPRKCQFASEGQRMSLTIVHSAAELAAHLTAWDELAANTIEPNVFYESWMLLPALAAFGAEAQLSFVLVYATGPSNEGSKPVLCGFFPLQRHARFRGLPVSYTSLWKYKYCVLCTPLLRPEYAGDCLAAFFGWLGRAPETGALLKLAYVTGDGLFQQLLTDYFNRARTLLSVEERFNRALLERMGVGAAASEAYINAALSGKRRKELRRQEKLLREQGQLEFVSFLADAPMDTEADTEVWLEQFLQLEAQGWKGAEGSALASAQASREYFLQIARAAAKRGQLMFLALRLDGQPIAMKCNLLSGAGAFAFKIAFDEAFASYSPGAQLELENIRRVHESTDMAPLEWMDSCATSKHFMINRLWLSRRTMQTMLVATGKGGGSFLVSVAPLLRWVKRKFFAHLPAQS